MNTGASRLFFVRDADLLPEPFVFLSHVHWAKDLKAWAVISNCAEKGEFCTIGFILRKKLL